MWGGSQFRAGELALRLLCRSQVFLAVTLNLSGNFLICDPILVFNNMGSLPKILALLRRFTAPLPEEMHPRPVCNDPWALSP